MNKKITHKKKKIYYTWKKKIRQEKKFTHEKENVTHVKTFVLIKFQYGDTSDGERRRVF